MKRKAVITMSQRFMILMMAGLSLSLVGCTTSSHVGSDDPGNIAGRTFVVTGASSGFGRGVAVKLGSHGSNVVLAARRTNILEKVAAEVRRRSSSTPQTIAAARLA